MMSDEDLQDLTGEFQHPLSEEASSSAIRDVDDVKPEVPRSAQSSRQSAKHVRYTSDVDRMIAARESDPNRSDDSSRPVTRRRRNSIDRIKDFALSLRKKHLSKRTIIDWLVALGLSVALIVTFVIVNPIANATQCKDVTPTSFFSCVRFTGTDQGNCQMEVEIPTGNGGSEYVILRAVEDHDKTPKVRDYEDFLHGAVDHCPLDWQKALANHFGAVFRLATHARYPEHEGTKMNVTVSPVADPGTQEVREVTLQESLAKELGKCSWQRSCGSTGSQEDVFGAFILGLIYLLLFLYMMVIIYRYT